MAGTNFYTPISSTCWVALTKEQNAPNADTQLATLAKCIGAPPTTANVFGKGCIMTRTDVGTGVRSNYENTGTSTAPSWTLMGNGTGTSTYNVVATNTSGTSVVNVFGATVPFAATLTGAYLTSRDTTAGTITVSATGGTVTTIPKFATANALVGSTVTNASIAVGDTLTVTSSSTGNATVYLTFTTS